MTEQEKLLLQRVAPTIGGVRYELPEPSGTAENRFRQRLAYFNQYHVFARKCDGSGKKMISMFSPLAKFPVYDNDFWHSDNWDARSYGRDFDFERPFFEQFFDLLQVVPQIARSINANQNCDYVNNADHNKNGYLIFNTTTSEDCMYGENVSYCKDSIDCTQTKRCELCYGCVFCLDCYQLRYSENCENCSQADFLFGCRSCSNCFGCANLYRKEYCVFNKQLTKEQYRDFLKGIDFCSYQQIEALKHKFAEFVSSQPRPHILSKQATNSTGNLLEQVKDVEESFLIFGGGETLSRCYNLEGPVRDCLEHSAFGLKAELCYQTVRSGLDIFGLAFCVHCADNCSNFTYCIGCRQSKNLFGCTGLRKAEYCVLNKQLSEEEYKQLVPKIIAHMRNTGEWGKFFPPQYSYIPYNCSLAQRFWPISKDESQKMGLPWYDKQEPGTSEGAVQSEYLDGLPGSDESIVATSIKSGRRFLITSREIARYRKLQVPLPRVTYDERIEARASKLGGIKLVTRECEQSGKLLSTIHGEETSFPLWSKDEYDREFFS